MLGLNKEQEKAVKHFKGPLLIIAGAGSGKTKALTHRIAYLIRARKVASVKILAVTFTNKAAGEMRERLQVLLGQAKSELPFVGTFHSLGVRILRKNIGLLGFSNNFGIYDAQDQLAVVKKCLKELNLDPKQFNPRMILGLISAAKNELQTPQDLEKKAQEFVEEITAKTYQLYQEKLKQAGACDFDDLLMLTVKLFKENPKVLVRYQSQFEFINVDEYQDTNHAQYILIKMLAASHKNLVVVGDDWQAIYGWRGANLRNILEFERDYPQASVILLEQNYRSTQNILDGAGQIIARNTDQKNKKLWTDKEAGDLIAVHEARDERDEATHVVSEIKQLIKGALTDQAIKPGEIVVLYRTNAQSRSVEEACLQADLPYQIVGGVRFYDRKEVKDVLAYLKLLANSKDSVSFERIINVPTRGLGPKSARVISRAAQEKFNGDFIEALLAAGDLSDLSGARALRARELGLSLHKIKQDLLSKKIKRVARLIEKIIKEFNFETYLRDGSSEGQMRFENVQELRTVAGERESLEEFLEQVALVQDVDSFDESAPAITLMTAHAAKGLEFEHVYIIGMEEGIFPHSRALLSPAELAEERRLCYVAMTRAKERLTLLYAASRQLYGDTQLNSRSRFLDEIDESLLEQTGGKGSLAYLDKSQVGRVEQKQSGGDRTRVGQIDESDQGEPWEQDDFENPFNVGDQVRHPRFGAGKVIQVDDDLVDVAFKKGGQKTLSVNFAPLEKVG